MNQEHDQVSRRRLFAGAGAVGAIAAAAAVLPVQPAAEAPQAKADAERDKPEGYRLTEHVKRYYQTAKV